MSFIFYSYYNTFVTQVSLSVKSLVFETLNSSEDAKSSEDFPTKNFVDFHSTLEGSFKNIPISKVYSNVIAVNVDSVSGANDFEEEFDDKVCY